jgi:hypothetical protein
MNKSSFHNLVRRILKEEIEKRVPEMDGNGLDQEKKNKTFSSDPNSRDTKSKDDMLEELLKAVKAVDPAFIAVWDDHDDLKIDGRDLGAVWITPLWEDNFKIVYMPRNEDRFFFTGLNWKQVLDFVKNNLDPKKHTSVEQARDKAWRNQRSEDEGTPKGKPQQDKPKEKGAEKTEDMNEEMDNPNKPMRPVGDFKRQVDHKAKRPAKRLKGKPVTQLKDYQR